MPDSLTLALVMWLALASEMGLRLPVSQFKAQSCRTWLSDTWPSSVFPRSCSPMAGAPAWAHESRSEAELLKLSYSLKQLSPADSLKWEIFILAVVCLWQEVVPGCSAFIVRMNVWKANLTPPSSCLRILALQHLPHSWGTSWLKLGGKRVSASQHWEPMWTQASILGSSPSLPVMRLGNLTQAPCLLCASVSSWMSEGLWLGLLQPELAWDSRWLKTLKDMMYNFLLKRGQQVEIAAYIPCQVKKQTEAPGERCLKVKSEFFQQIVLQKMSCQRGLMLCHVRSIIHFWSSRTWMTQGKSPSVLVKPWKSSSYELSVWNQTGLGWNLDSFTS